MYGYVQSSAPAVQTGTTATVSLTGVSAGSALVLAIKVSSENRSIVSVSDGTNTWAVGANSSLIINGSSTTSLYYAINAASGNPTVTVTFDGAATDVYLVLAEYSGIATASAFDVDANVYNSGASASPTLSTSNQPDLIVVCSLSVTGSRPLTTPTGLAFTTRQNIATPQLLFADARSTATGAQSITQAVTGGNSGISVIALALKEAGGGTPGNASGAGVTDAASAPAGSAAQVSVKITGFRLISKTGAPVVSASGITALIYKSVPSSLVAPDKRIASVTTNGSGTLMDLDISDIQSDATPVWLVLMSDGSPPKGSTIKVTPTVV